MVWRFRRVFPRVLLVSGILLLTVVLFLPAVLLKFIFVVLCTFRLFDCLCDIFFAVCFCVVSWTRALLIEIILPSARTHGADFDFALFLCSVGVITFGK